MKTPKTNLKELAAQDKIIYDAVKAEFGNIIPEKRLDEEVREVVSGIIKLRFSNTEEDVIAVAIHAVLEEVKKGVFKGLDC